jgi:hypothetical protein
MILARSSGCWIEVWSYAQWRSTQLERMPGAFVPMLTPGCWALVLWVMRPSGVSAFARNQALRDLYVAPQVGMFASEVARPMALAGVIGTYLADLRCAVQIAPPILAVTLRGRPQLHIEALERAWTLPATEVVGVRR